MFSFTSANSISFFEKAEGNVQKRCAIIASFMVEGDALAESSAQESEQILNIVDRQIAAYEEQFGHQWQDAENGIDNGLVFAEGKLAFEIDLLALTAADEVDRLNETVSDSQKIHYALPEHLLDKRERLREKSERFPLSRMFQNYFESDKSFQYCFDTFYKDIGNILGAPFPSVGADVRLNVALTARAGLDQWIARERAVSQATP